MEIKFYFNSNESSSNHGIPKDYVWTANIVKSYKDSLSAELFGAIERQFLKDKLAESCYSEVFYSYVEEANVLIITVTYLYDTVESDTFVLRFDYEIEEKTWYL